MQEPVYVLHLITCHGRIMPRLVELLFCFLLKINILCALFNFTILMLPVSLSRHTAN